MIFLDFRTIKDFLKLRFLLIFIRKFFFTFFIRYILACLHHQQFCFLALPTIWLSCTANNLVYTTKDFGVASKNVGMRAKMLACEQKCWLASKNVGMQAKMLANNSLKNFPYKKLKYYILRVLFCSKV